VKFNFNLFGKRKQKQISCKIPWEKRIKILEKTIGYSFKDLKKLRNSLVHLSYIKGKKNKLASYERMEFFGDAILGFLLAETLYKKYSKKEEGFLSKIKSMLESEKYLGEIAKRINLGEYLFLSNEEKRSGGKQKVSILSDAMEALICAIYLDGGIEKTRKFVTKVCLEEFEKEIKRDYLQNYKSLVQEYFQSKYQKYPIYKVVSEKGPEHKKMFLVEVLFDDKIYGQGRGPNKKSAEQSAAKLVWKELKKKN